MSKTFNFPNYKHIRFIKNVQTGYFVKSEQQPEPVATQIIPFELIREKTILPHIRAEYSLFQHSYKANNSKVMFTVLQPVQNQNEWYLGDNFRVAKGKKVNELLIIKITAKNDRMHVFYFPVFYKNTDTLRQKFSTLLISTLEKRVIDFETK